MNKINHKEMEFLLYQLNQKKLRGGGEGGRAALLRKKEKET